MDKQLKQDIIAKYATHEGDTGSPEVQVALLTERINHLTEHLKIHKGSPLQKRTAEDGWSEKRAVELLDEEGHYPVS